MLIILIIQEGCGGGGGDREEGEGEHEKVLHTQYTSYLPGKQIVRNM